jgi:hypothetical protein
LVANTRNAAGHDVYFFMCSCGYRSGKFISKEKIRREQIPYTRVAERYPLERCVVCGALGAEEHHWAPWAIFKDESERWPKSFLCPSCHRRWHDLVTPRWT